MIRRGKQSSTTNQQKCPRTPSRTPDQRLIPNREVGEEWPEPFPVEDSDSSHTKYFIAKSLTISFVVLLFALTGYAMATKDKQTLVEIADFVRTALIGVLCSVITVWKKHTKDH